jgi:hydrogenase small subunit
MAFFGQNIHDRCYRRPFYERGQFAETFDDEGARKGYCLYKLGCKGPVTYNACATLKWNERRQLAGPVRPRLHRLLRTEFLGQGQLLPAAVGGLLGRREDRRHQCRGGRRSRPRRGSALARGKQKKAQQEEKA